ncbi:MAG TPA: metalloregulator ArsR/SmtB family transcription factor [Candidatus Hydrogenedentes bacterium]|nr:metalloregulator ArsR/SmtB family transcription factor [Candidatus Hydrogenedentota bacterium]
MSKSPTRQYQDAIYEQLARVGKALAHPSRLELLDLLAQTERSVEALSRETGLSIASTSQHLQALRAARLVSADKRGLYVFYRLADPLVHELLSTVRRLAEHRLAEIEQTTRRFLEGREGMEPVSKAVLLERVKRGEVTVLDVRPPEEYQAGHLPGALSIPLAELEQRLATLPRDQEIVAYCRGPYCVLSIQAVEFLRARGFHAVRLEDSVHDLQAHGLPIAVGEA